MGMSKAGSGNRIINIAAIVMCVMALTFALGAGRIHTKSVTVSGSKLAPIDPSEPEISGTGFAPDAVFENIAPHISGIPLYGSAVAGDASTGLVRTRWYHPFKHFNMLISGYTVNQNCDVYLEVFSPTSGIAKVPIQFDENPEYWRLQRLSLASYPDATKFRIVAVDNSQKPFGWLGFSAPFLIPKQNATQLPLQLLLILFCTTACLAGVLGPGLALRFQSSVWIPFPGILILATIGLLVWFGPGSREVIARGCLALVFLLVGASLIRRPLTSRLSSSELRVLGIIVLLVVIAVAKSSYSIGPSGELYRGTISHSLEAGTRSDSRITYHVVDLIASRESPYGTFGTALFAPWTFSHRGPIAGLAATPFVLCTKNVTFARYPLQIIWTLFDPHGFTAYRIAMIVLAAASLFPVFGLARLFLDEQWAMLAFLVIAAAPFTVHEIFFTWPKILAAGFVLLAAYLVMNRGCFPAGFAIGLGYLCHPSVLLCFPGILGLTIVAVNKRTSFLQRVWFIASACTGLAFWLAAWRLINRGHFEQDSFFWYFYHTNPFLPLNTINWLHSRLVNLSVTLVPLNVFFFHRTDPEFLPIDRTQNAWVQFVHQYWSTLAFGAGCVFYPVLIWLVGVGFARAKAWAWLVIVPPFLLFVIYWGPGNTGLLREGLHAWVFGLLLFAVIMWNRHLANSEVFWKCATLALAFRGIETLGMLIPFSAWSRGYLLQHPYQSSDLLMLILMAGGTGLLTFAVVAQCRLVQGEKGLKTARITGSPERRIFQQGFVEKSN